MIMHNQELKKKLILRAHLYVSDDTEPLEALEAIYPFEKVTTHNVCEYDTIFGSLTSVGFKEAINVIMEWLCNTSPDENGYPLGAGSNLMEAFDFYLTDELYFKNVVFPAVSELSTSECLELDKLISSVLLSERLDDRDRTCFRKFLKLISKRNF